MEGYNTIIALLMNRNKHFEIGWWKDSEFL
jgi:hypothetical protein